MADPFQFFFCFRARRDNLDQNPKNYFGQQPRQFIKRIIPSKWDLFFFIFNIIA
jgi:hypothetical protein